MRIVDTSRPSAIGPVTNTRRSAGEGAFTLGEAKAAPEPARPASIGALASVSGVLALQAADDPLVRRRKAIRRGHALLDALDEMKMALLSGEAPPSARLAALARDSAERTGDDGLDAVLADIELRAAVEMAKRQKSTAGHIRTNA